TRTSDFSNLPTGWSTPSGGGLHLMATAQVDLLGRDTQIIAPNGSVTYLVYNDPDHWARVYAGWNAATLTPTLTTAVDREDRQNSYAESFTMTAAPHTTGGVPDGTEAVGSLQTLSRSYTNAAGQVVTQEDYFNLAGVTYSVAPHLGTQDTNYYQAQLGYDS